MIRPIATDHIVEAIKMEETAAFFSQLFLELADTGSGLQYPCSHCH